MFTGLPSVGKTRLLNAVLDSGLGYVTKPIWVTRPRRPGEVHRRDMHFTTEEVFGRVFDSRLFVESEMGKPFEFTGYLDHRYGTPGTWLRDLPCHAPLVCVSYSTEVAKFVKERRPDIAWIHLTASQDTRVKRLEDRGLRGEALEKRVLNVGGDSGCGYDMADAIIDTSHSTVDETLQQVLRVTAK